MLKFYLKLGILISLFFGINFLKAQIVNISYDGIGNTYTLNRTINEGFKIVFSDVNINNNLYTNGQNQLYFYAGVDTGSGNWEYIHGNIGIQSTLGVFNAVDTNLGANPNLYEIVINPKSYFNIPEGTMIYGIYFNIINQFYQFGQTPINNNQTQNFYIDLIDQAFTTECTQGDVSDFSDFDCDGVLNIADLDDDNDGILDFNECLTINGEYSGTFGTSPTAPFVRDLAFTPQGYFFNPGPLGPASSYAVVNGLYPASNYHIVFNGVNGHTTGLPDDNFLVVNGSSVRSALYKQEINLVAGTTFTIGCWYLDPGAGTSSQANLGIRVAPVGSYLNIANTNPILDSNGNPVEITTGPIPWPPNIWKNLELVFVAATTGIYEVQFYNVSQESGGNDFAFDDLYISGCPLNDGDSMLDRYDTDSDNDGCPDALESLNSPYTWADLNTHGSINTDLYPIGLSGSQLGVPNSMNYLANTSQNPNVQSAECTPCDPVSSLFTDFDGDGVANPCDLDNDNDGILNENEAHCQEKSISLTYQNGSNILLLNPETGVETPLTTVPADISLSAMAVNYDQGGLIYGYRISSPSTLVVYDPETALWTNVGTIPSSDFSAGGGAYYDGAIYMGSQNKELYKINLSADGKTMVSYSLFSKDPTSMGLGDWGDIAIGKGCNGNPTLFVSIDPWGLGTIDLNQAADTDNYALQVSNSYFGQIGYANGKLYCNNSGTSLVELEVCKGIATPTGFSFSAIPQDIAGGVISCQEFTDTDGDGLPDFKDLDSDGDGCFDAIESTSSPYTDLDLVASGAIDTSNYPIGSDPTSTTSYGVPSSVSYELGDSANPAVSNCHCVVKDHFDWSEFASSFPPGTLSHNYNLGALPITTEISFSGTFETGTPSISSIYRGNLVSSDETLLLSGSGISAGTNSMVANIKIGTLGVGAEGVYFKIFDVDGYNDGNIIYSDKVQVNGYLNGVLVQPTLIGTSLHTRTGNVVVAATQDAPALGAGSELGVIEVVFATAIDELEIIYSIENSGTGIPANTGIGLYDINFCRNICYLYPTTGVQVPSKIGISTLNRTTNQNGNQWPESVNSANLVIESKKKGLVLPRLTSTQISDLTPKEGMIVFDVSANCLKMYDGLSWFCIKQTCNE